MPEGAIGVILLALILLFIYLLHELCKPTELGCFTLNLVGDTGYLPGEVTDALHKTGQDVNDIVGINWLERDKHKGEYRIEIWYKK